MMKKTMLQQLLRDQSVMKNDTALDALKAQGKALRDTIPAETLGERTLSGRDPVAYIEAIEQNLIQELMPQRHAKMAASPAAFFRGTAELMAYDLSHEPQSGIRVLSDGDAHLQNFGFYASAERNLLFDLNDFDEAAPNSFEFDLKRLATSVYLLGAQRHFDEAPMDDLVQNLVRTYRKALKHAFKEGALERFYASSNVEQLLAALPDEDDVEFVKRVMAKAQKQTNESVVAKYTERATATRLRFKDAAPRSVHVEPGREIALMSGYLDYQKTTRADITLLLGQYHVSDIIRHSVGIGSFGTYCYLILLTGLGGSHLVLQVKEALPRRRELAPNNLAVTLDREVSEGQRIIAAQQILQKASDPFLGWFNLDGKSFYVRQFRDMKESINLDRLEWGQFEAYCRICAYLLAMAHAQSPTAAVADGYLNRDVDIAIQGWAKDYLHQVVDDYAAFVAKYGVDQ
nr:DUF2252 domain-containing protein [Lacticaseibacillus mingshuiensis]